MSNHYAEGVRIEHIVIHDLQANGYETTRAASSSKGVAACVIEGCPRGGKLRRGMCNTCYLRLRKSGEIPPRSKSVTPIVRGMAPQCACGCGYRTSTVRTTYILGHRPAKSLKERIEGRYLVDLETGCWNWTGSRGSNGYGMVWFLGRRVMAHRAFYEVHVGQIRPGLVIDHLCFNRACVNPVHLDPVTQSENVRRGHRWAS